jgi:DNA-binding MarR family transcriptional regulator
MEILFSGNKMITPPPIRTSLEMKETVQRLFRMRHRFRVGLPENIADLKNRLHKIRQGNPAENVSDFDSFYNIGIVFSRQSEPLTMGDLSRQLNVPLSSATRIMDWLVTNGYAERLPDADDRRVVRVALTEAGNAMYREIDAFFMERIERLMRGLTPEERNTFHGLLQKIVSNMEQEA